jgi:RNA polymerase sigma-70 factor (ECF subfamily)
MAARDMSPSHPDLDLLKRIQKGDAKALGIILERYWAPVVRYAAAILGCPDAAEDVAQDTFVRLWERRDAWTMDGSVRALLYRIARNLGLDERRRRSARQRADEGTAFPVSVRTPDELIEDDEIRTAIGRAVDMLPERRREVFILVRHHGLSYREAAGVLDLAPQTVANHLTMAVSDLRKALAPFFYDHAEDRAEDKREDLSA